MGVFDNLAQYEAIHGPELRDPDATRNLAAEIIDTPQWEESSTISDDDD